MRRRSLASVAVAIAVTACGNDTGGDTDLSQTFRSPVYGYKMRVPGGWSTLTADHELEPGEPPLIGELGTDVVAGMAARTVRDMTLPAIVIGAQPAEPGTDSAAWADDAAGVVASFKGCAEPASTDEIRVDDETAILLTYPDCPEGLGLDHLWVAFIHGDRAFRVVWFDESGGGTVEREQLEQILSTVSFTR